MWTSFSSMMPLRPSMTSSSSWSSRCPLPPTHVHTPSAQCSWLSRNHGQYTIGSELQETRDLARVRRETVSKCNLPAWLTDQVQQYKTDAACIKIDAVLLFQIKVGFYPVQPKGTWFVNFDSFNSDFPHSQGYVLNKTFSGCLKVEWYSAYRYLNAHGKD